MMGSNWKVAVAIEQANDPLGAILDSVDDNLDFDLTGLTFDEAVARIEQCVVAEGGSPAVSDKDDKDDKDADLTPCQEALKLLQSLANVIEDYEGAGGGNEGDPGQTGEATPEVIQGSVTQQSDTQGMTFEYGRMSWTDVP